MQSAKLPASPAGRQFKVQNLFSPLSIIVFAVILRLIPHPPNLAPIGAMALFGGTYLDRRYALIAPLIAMFISDLFLGLHTTMPFVYGSFFLTGLIGLWLRGRRKPRYIIGASFLSSLMFFLITNFGVWIATGMYQKNLAGLLEAYVLAIPFFRNTIIGDLLYTGVFFGGYELVLKCVYAPQSAKERL